MRGLAYRMSFALLDSILFKLVWHEVLLMNVTGVLMHQHHSHQRTLKVEGDVRICNVEILHWLTQSNKRQISSSRFGDDIKKSFSKIVGYSWTELPVSFLSWLLGDRCELDGTCSCSTNYTGLACENHCPSGCNGKGACTGGRDHVFHLCFDDTRQVAIDEGQSSEMKDFQSHCRPSEALKYLHVWVETTYFDVFKANVFDSFPCWILYESQPMQIWLPKDFWMVEWDRVKEMSKRHSALDYEVPKCTTW